MANDLVARLKNELGWGIGPALLCQEAAARIEELEKALKNSAEGWANLLELGLIPERHRPTAVGLREEAFAAISASAYKGA